MATDNFWAGPGPLILIVFVLPIAILYMLGFKTLAKVIAGFFIFSNVMSYASQPTQKNNTEEETLK